MKKEDDEESAFGKHAEKFLTYAAASAGGNALLTDEQREALELDDVVSYLRDIYWNVLLGSTFVFWCTVFAYTYFFWFRDRFLVTVTLLAVGALCGLMSLQRSKNAPRLLPALFHIPRSQFPIWLERSGPAMSIVAALLSGAVVGLLIYAVFGRTAVVYQNSRRYFNAETNVPAGAFADAGRIIFNENVHVDPHKSAGFFAADGNTYCVAGIKAESDTRVEFWAVGVNCCEPQSNFYCGPVADEAAKAGLRVLDSRGIFPKLGGSREYFEAARLKAEAALGLPQAGDVEPIYLRWGFTEEVKNAVNWYRWHAFLLIGLATGFYFLACALALWYAMQPTPKKEKEDPWRMPKYGPDGMPRGHYGADGMPVDFMLKTKPKWGADGMPIK